MVEHSLKNSVLTAPNSPIAIRRRAWREFKDRIAKYGVAFGGLSVIFAIVLIFFYLLYVVMPLFYGADIETKARFTTEKNTAAHVTLNEYNDVGLSLDMQGKAHFFAADTGITMLAPALPLAEAAITSFSKGAPSTGVFAYGFANGQALVFKQEYKISYPNDKRTITPRIDFPIGESTLYIDTKGQSLQLLSVQGNDEQTTVAAVTTDNRLVLKSVIREQDFMDEDAFTIEELSAEIILSSLVKNTHLAIDIDQRELYLVDDEGNISYYDIQNIVEPRLVQKIRAVPSGVEITTLEFLTGGISILVGRSDGQIDQWFPVRDKDNNYTLHNVRSFHEQSAAIIAISPEYSRKGFLVLDASGQLGLYHTTAERTLLIEPLIDSNSEHAVMAISPRANGVLSLTAEGQVQLLHIENEHPDVSWHSLWEKVWYESRDKPQYIWQSSSASNDFEPKFSLTPLTFGTLKAAFYAMAIAVPLAIFGAIYAAYFMSPSMRKVVKPTIEIMEALPTVILGFLAGLWLAPIVEGNLPGVFSIFVLTPIMIVLTAWLWTKLPAALRERIPDGWEAAILVPVVILVATGSMMASPYIEALLFNNNMPEWLNNHGFDFDQRNSLVVGMVMGFAVIPTIFSITEDAIFGVPKHLTIGSLALGATPWQTLTRVVILTASPGIFSAVMIGLGRAVGETMIVLMATGNTPIMDFNIFEGFRALSANIAVEMPEAEVASSHYRVLFLAALVLFTATFFFNTVAEVVRQRLRNKYSSL